MKEPSLPAFAATLVLGMLMGAITVLALSSARASSPATEVVASGSSIIFMVDGHEQARLDATGLQVNGDIGYSGAITDTVSYRANGGAAP